jgi:Tol biopolymer transport system component
MFERIEIRREREALKPTLRLWVAAAFAAVAALAFFTALAAANTTPFAVAAAYGAVDDDDGGGRLAFVKSGDIWTMNTGGHDLRQLTTDPAVDRWPSWSPDGTKIAFTSTRTGHREIWVMDADGTNQHQITNDLQNDGSPNWSADGTELVYQINFENTYVIKLDGTGERLLRNSAITPDASRTNVVALGEESTGGLSTINLDGTNQLFVPNTGGQTAFDPDWSPAGDRLAYLCAITVDPAVSNNVCSIAPDGSGFHLLDGRTDRVDFSPTWSPNGKKVASIGCLDFGTLSQRCEVYTVKQDGTHAKQLTSFGVDGGAGSLDWQSSRN